MSKRLGTTSSSAGVRKKTKVDASQRTLHNFFEHKQATSSSSAAQATPRVSAVTGEASSSKLLHGSSSSLHVSPVEIIDVDELDDDTNNALVVNSERVASTASHVLSKVVNHNNPTYPELFVDPIAFDIDNCPWPFNSPAPYSFLAHSLSSLSETRSRISILNILTNTIRALLRYSPEALLPALYLLSNSLSPPYIPVELGLGPSSISTCIRSISGLTSSALRKLYARTGDAGDVAFEAKSKVRTLIPHPPLIITSLYSSLLKIARTRGSGAVKEKQRIAEHLMVSAKGEEIRFLVRTLSQHIRVGAVRTSILTGLARALVLSPPQGVDENILDYSLHLEPSKLSGHRINLAPVSSKKPSQADTDRASLIERYNRAEALIKRVFVQHPNYDDIANALLEKGLTDLAERVPLCVGIPLHPTLGSPMRSLDEVYERLGDIPFVAEFKYDGQRAQIHASRNGSLINLKIFSRHLEDMTEKYPDVVFLFEQVLVDKPALSSLIIDAEIVAVDPTSDEVRSFQELSNRSRKDVKIDDIQVPVAVYVFDLMYSNDKILLGEPFRYRRSILQEHFPPTALEHQNSARLRHVESCMSKVGKEAVEEFWLKAVESRCEGLMIKALDSGEVTEAENREGKARKKPLPATYEPDKRTFSWLKLKKDYVMTLGDTLDLVPIGAWHGNGRKAQWWSPVLLALRDPETESLVALCKCMSGFSDSFYKEMTARYSEDSENCARRPLWGDVDFGGYTPSVYFRPHEIWEIRGADVTLSPVSTAARGAIAEDRGLSLRFPRFIRTREDKAVDAASTPDFVASMWRKQQGTGGAVAGPSADDGELVDALSSEEVEAEESDDGAFG